MNELIKIPSGIKERLPDECRLVDEMNNVLGRAKNIRYHAEKLYLDLDFDLKYKDMFRNVDLKISAKVGFGRLESFEVKTTTKF